MNERVELAWQIWWLLQLKSSGVRSTKYDAIEIKHSSFVSMSTHNDFYTTAGTRKNHDEVKVRRKIVNKMAQMMG